MDALQQSTAIHALALAIAKELNQQDATRLGLMLVQLGTTLSPITALEELNSGVATETLTNR